MPRFLTPEWVAAYNDALADTTLPAPGPDSGLAATDGRFTVAQNVSGSPDGDVRLVMVAADGGLRFAVTPLVPTGADRPDRGVPEPEVTIALSYTDAVALATGALSPAEALNQGRIRVRGDLSVLVAGQQMLESARALVETLGADTTY